MAFWNAHFADCGSDAEGHLIRCESKSSAIFCRQLRAAAERTPFRFALGGEHLVSFPLIEAAQQRHPGLKLIVFDAHHDAYSYPLLTHHSLFHYTQHDLAVPTMLVGPRFELELTDAPELVDGAALARLPDDQVVDSIARFVGDSPFYFSIDVDVLDPREFPAVSAPVDGGLSIVRLTTLTRRILAMRPVAADITEYNPMRDDARASALARLAPVAREFSEWMHATA